MKKRLTIFVEGDTDKLFFDYLISFLFENANKRRWDKSQLCIITLGGICNADSIIENAILDLSEKDKFEDSICLIYDTDAFEFQKKPPIKLERVKKIAFRYNCSFFSLPIVHNVEDMIVFSKNEIKKFLCLPTNYETCKDLSGLALLKRMHKDAGLYYVKGNKCDGLLKCLNYSSIAKKYCTIIRPLCDYFEIGCDGKLCKIKRK